MALSKVDKSDKALVHVERTQRYIRKLATVVGIVVILIQLTMFVRAELYHACTASYLEEIVEAVNTGGLPIKAESSCPQRLNVREKQ